MLWIRRVKRCCCWSRRTVKREHQERLISVVDIDPGSGQTSCIGLQIPDELRCCICLCASQEVLLMSCPHRVCTSCAERGRLKACPVCNHTLPQGARRDSDFAQRARTTCLTCTCGARVMLLEADKHHCEHTWVPQLHASNEGNVPPKPVNRLTFICPLCKETNLSRQGLLEHCEQRHSSSRVGAVCPVCASMPWGDPSYVSPIFLRHLRLRHKCDYDVICDYGASEEESLRQALQASSIDRENDTISAQILKEPAEQLRNSSAVGQSEDERLAFAIAESLKECSPERR